MIATFNVFQVFLRDHETIPSFCLCNITQANKIGECKVFSLHIFMLQASFHRSKTLEYTPAFFV